MKKIFLPLAGLALSFNVNAALVNGGFETGDLTGWSVGALTGSGSASVVTSNTTTYSPGTWGAPVTTNPNAGNYMLAIGSGSAEVWQEVSQTVSLASGESIGGAAFFDWGDYWVADNAFPDGLKVEILDGSGAVADLALFTDGTDYCLSFCSPGTDQAGAESGWLDWGFTAASAGDYTVVYGVKNTQDGGGPNVTYGYFDTSVVPEPSIIALFATGLLGMVFVRRRKYS